MRIPTNIGIFLLLRGNFIMTQKAKLLKAFQKGLELSTTQIRSRYKILSPTKVVSRLREDGVKIQTKEIVRGKSVTYKYALTA
jgi:hypothetical protein